ncbi:MAG TPA: phosphoribosylformylglycinamidine synthase subunit PurL, partial [Novosphingobium sp.]|nr:phosphoribosylformylglycinamidine synthase subunit PurL [Novosphingobium sp.]
MSAITPDVVAAHGLSEEEYARVLNAIGREPNLVELGIFSVMWSEHCSYKSSRFHLKKLPTSAPWVIQGPGENAGVIDIGDGQAAIFKMESHNHPSYIEPYQGAATGVGGILRDVFTMGARPVANMNALRFGRPDHPKMKHLVQGVVAGIGGYGNCVGVPTVGGETNFHRAYDGNILVNAMTVGVAQTDRIFYCAATGLGNPIVYVGSKTGRDGIHGATMASADFDEKSEEKRPTVQVGDPFTEKLLIEACLELMATDAIVAIQDMGAAGLTSSSVEMASKGGAGIRLDMNKVPCREEGMTPYEMMLSESQERMLMVLKPGREAFAEAIFRKWELDFAVIGREVLAPSHRLLVDGETVCDIPLGPLADDAPEYERPYITREEYRVWANVPALGEVPESADLGADLLTLMASPDLASRKWIWEQYDSQVGADTLQKSGGDAAVVRVHGTHKALAISTDCTPRYCYADPVEGGKQAVAECWRNLTATGALPLAATDNLNFGNPERAEIMGQLVHAIKG